ncbi:MAG: hypothetical protein M1366_00745 [Patescibacteria group bacterium]|nr:hypothetical protein [Patescibacteria group bacterium]
MRLKQFIAATAFAGTFIASSALPVFAQNFGNGLIRDVNRLENQATKTAQRQENQLQNIIQRADTLITNRLTSLTNLNNRVQNDSKLTSSEKSSLSAEIQTDINGLTTLKAKIDADTDFATARTDAKQIITGYYIYAVFEPKIRLLIVINNLQTVTANIQVLVPQIQNLINTFQSQGKNVSQLQSLLNDASSQLQTINTTLTNDITTVQNVSVNSGTSGAETTFAQVRQDIAQVVRAGFAKIRSDFSQMRTLFHELIIAGQPVSSSSATVQTPSVIITQTPTSTATGSPATITP